MNNKFANLVSATNEINVLKSIQPANKCREDVACYHDDFINYADNSYIIVSNVFLDLETQQPAMTLQNYLNENIHEMSEILTIYYNIIKSLVYLHNMKIVHNDIKPSNILVDRQSLNTHIIDFGISCQQRYCIDAGTKRYLSPYQPNKTIFGRPFHEFNDIYAMAVLLEDMLNSMGSLYVSNDKIQYELNIIESKYSNDISKYLQKHSDIEVGLKVWIQYIKKNVKDMTMIRIKEMMSPLVKQSKTLKNSIWKSRKWKNLVEFI